MTPKSAAMEEEGIDETQTETERQTETKTETKTETEQAERDQTAMMLPADLTFHQARTALDLMIAELQSSDLEVEEMLNLYRRAQAYADHCESVLQKVDQDVIEWDVLQEKRGSQP